MNSQENDSFVICLSRIEQRPFCTRHSFVAENVLPYA